MNSLKLNVICIVLIIRLLVGLFLQKLRAAIASTYYKDLAIEETDMFVSDGAKCDISRLQVVFHFMFSLCFCSISYIEIDDD